MDSKKIETRRQNILHVEQDFELADLTSGTAVSVIYLKPGARVLGGFIDITTAFNSGDTDTLSVGDTEADDVDRYLVATDVSSTGLTKFTLPPVADGIIDTPEAITITWTGAGTAATAGAGRVAVDYIEDGRQTEVHTYRG